MAHPDLRGLGQAVEQRTRRLGDRELGKAVLADVGLGDVPAQVQRHLLDAVAEAQDGDAQLEHGRVHVRRALGVHARRPAREDQRSRSAARDLLGGDVERHDLRVDPGLSDATRDELRVLRPEVQDEDGRLILVLELRHASGPSRRPGSSADLALGLERRCDHDLGLLEALEVLVAGGGHRGAQAAEEVQGAVVLVRRAEQDLLERPADAGATRVPRGRSGWKVAMPQW